MDDNNMLKTYRKYKTISGCRHSIEEVKDFISKVGTDDAVIYALKNYTLSHQRSPFGHKCRHHVIWNERKPEDIMKTLNKTDEMDEVKEILSMAKDLDYVMKKMTDCSTSRRDTCAAMTEEEFVWYYDELIKTENKTDLHKKYNFRLSDLDDMKRPVYLDGIEGDETSDSD